MELKGGPAMTSGLGLPQNQIMDTGVCGGLVWSPDPQYWEQDAWPIKRLIVLVKVCTEMGHFLGELERSGVGRVGSGKGLSYPPLCCKKGASDEIYM